MVITDIWKNWADPNHMPHYRQPLFFLKEIHSLETVAITGP